MTGLFELFFYQPIFNIFIALYDVIPDVGIAIVILTLIIKFALYPLNAKSIAAQKSLQELQPKLEALKKEHKDDQQKLAQETMKIYKENKVNPFGSCLPLLIQLPILFAIYWVLRNEFSALPFDLLYSFVPQPESVNPLSLGLFDMSTPSIVLALLAGAAQFWQAKMMTARRAPKEAGDGAKDENMMTMMNKQMLYFMPIITILIGMQFPAGLALYWFLSTAFTAVQQMILFRKKKENEVLPA